jgi:hypothetical protein
MEDMIEGHASGPYGLTEKGKARVGAVCQGRRFGRGSPPECTMPRSETLSDLGLRALSGRRESNPRN